MAGFSAARIWAVVGAIGMILGTRAPWYTQEGGPVSLSLTEQHSGLAFAISACAALPLLVALISLTIAPNDRPNVAQGMAAAALGLAALGTFLPLSALSPPDGKSEPLSLAFGPAITILSGVGTCVACAVFVRWAGRTPGART